MEDPEYQALQERLARAYTKAAMNVALKDLLNDERIMAFLYEEPHKHTTTMEEIVNPNFAKRMSAIILAFEKTADPKKPADQEVKINSELYYEHLVQSAGQHDKDSDTIEFAMDAVREYARKLERGGYEPL